MRTPQVLTPKWPPLRVLPAVSIWKPTRRTYWKSRWADQTSCGVFFRFFPPLSEEVFQLSFPHYLWQDLSSPVSADADSTASSKDPEDIPTFDEWKRKMMEVEKEKSTINTFKWFASNWEIIQIKSAFFFLLLLFLPSIALSTHTSNNGGSHTVKKVQKNFHNYASVECGAKLLGANPEAKVLCKLFLAFHTDVNTFHFLSL